MDPQSVTKTIVAVAVGIFLIDFWVEQLLKPGFRIVMMIAEQVCDHVSKRISQLISRLQVFLWRINIFDDYNDMETKQIQMQ